MNIKEYVKTHKGSTNVAWTLFVRDNIKKGDYARLSTGEIVKIIGIKENKLNKKAIYFEPYDEYNWCDSIAVKSFSENIIELIEVGDYVNGLVINLILDDGKVYHDAHDMLDVYQFEEKDIKTILTHEMYEQNCYKVGDIE